MEVRGLASGGLRQGLAMGGSPSVQPHLSYPLGRGSYNAFGCPCLIVVISPHSRVYATCLRASFAEIEERLLLWVFELEQDSAIGAVILVIALWWHRKRFE